MRGKRIVGTLVGLVGVFGAGMAAARADEGMWPYNSLPARQVQAKYGFGITDAWATHLQRASVHVGGASGSFVSADGLERVRHSDLCNQPVKAVGRL